MIGKIKGIVEEKNEDTVIIDVNGVGYEIYCSNKTIQKIPSVGEHAKLEIETHVRENEIKLFGFITTNEKNWFKMLQNVQGVGAKVATAILGTITVEQLQDAIAIQDKNTIAQTPGVGPKVAQRIITELKDKTGTINVPDIGQHDTTEPNERNDALSALVNLGYSAQQAHVAVVKAQKESKKQDSATLIRLALKELSR